MARAPGRCVVRSLGAAAAGAVFAALAGLGWALGQHAAVAVVATTVLFVVIGAREVRASLGSAVRRRAELSLGSVPLAPGSTLIAIVCPDQLAQLPDLIARASVASESLVVLAIEPAVVGAKLAIPRPAPKLLAAQDPRTRAALEKAFARLRRPVTFMTASGLDVATVTLDVARRIAAREVFALSADGLAADADARRAACVWQELPQPKAPLSVRLVVNAGEARAFRSRRAPSPPA